MKVQRNDHCPCKSGKKYKKCCLNDPAKNAEITRAASLADTNKELVEILSTPAQVYRLKVTLIRMGSKWIDQQVSRTFELNGKSSLYDFHLDIQHAFDWDNDHMFSFYIGDKLFDPKNEYSANQDGEHLVSGLGPRTKPAAETQIRDLQLEEDFTFLYLFDYGDELVHEVRVEKIRDKKRDDKLSDKLSIILNKTGTPPPQYEL